MLPLYGRLIPLLADTPARWRPALELSLGPQQLLLFNATMSANASQQHCAALGGWTLAPYSLAEQVALASALRAAAPAVQGVWLGMHSANATSGPWLWTEPHQALVWTAWDWAQPAAVAGSAPFCAMLNVTSSSWRTISCSAALPVACVRGEQAAGGLHCCCRHGAVKERPHREWKARRGQTLPVIMQACCLLAGSSADCC